MFTLRRALSASKYAIYETILPSNKYLSSKKGKAITMVDPKRVVSYEDMLKVIHQPEKVIIDVRNPDEVTNTGKIPSSINIPCNC